MKTVQSILHAQYMHENKSIELQEKYIRTSEELYILIFI